MPAGVTTLLDVRNSCKSQTDNINSTFLTDAEWNALINTAYYELYGLIVQTFGSDYFVQSPSSGYTFTTDGINDHFALPSTFFKLLGVDVAITATQFVSLKPFAFADRNRYSVTGTSIPMAGQTIRLLYVPRMVLLTLDADTIDGVNGWEDWIVCKACVMALAKEESDVSVFMARIKMLQDRLDSEIENRDAGTSAKIVDVLWKTTRGMQYRLNGNNLWLIGGTTPGWAPYGDWGGLDDYWGNY